MPKPFRDLAADVLTHIRRVPLVHRPVHWIAVLLVKTPLGARFVRSVLSTEAHSTTTYQAWVEAYDTLSDADRAAIAAHVARMARTPLISVVMPVYDTPAHLLREAIESVRAQIYSHWELCIADDASPDPAVWRLLRCNPWTDGGYDPVDPADREQHERAVAAREARLGRSSPPTHEGAVSAPRHQRDPVQPSDEMPALRRP